jgi:hypothetical protein
MGVVIVALWFLAGAVIEGLNTFSRKWTVDRLGQRGAVGWLVAGFLLRLGSTAAVLALSFRYSVPGGAAALVGYLAARWAAVVWLSRYLNRAAGA